MNTKFTKPKSKISNIEDRTTKLSDYWRERTIFPGVVPKEVKILIKNIPTMDKNFFRKLIKVALGYLQGTLSQEKCEIAFENLCKVKGCETEDDVIELSVQYVGVISILRAILKVNLKTVHQDTLMHDLQELGLLEDFASDVCKVVFGPAHADIVAQIVGNSPCLTRVEELQWSVDVTLSNNWSSKVLEPSISMRMRTSDGRSHSFDVPLSSFHSLRHSTASILRQMEALERRK